MRLELDSFKTNSFSAGLSHPFNRASRESVPPDLNQTRASGTSIRERGARGQGHYVLRLLLPPKFIE
jgi:hypothetical protein